MQDFLGSAQCSLRHFGTDPAVGLSEEQAVQNRETYGRNTLTREKPPTLARRLFEAAREPMILMLVMAGIIDIVVNIIRAVTGGHADFLECVGIFAAIALSVVISVVMEGRSAKAFEALANLSEHVTVRVLRGGAVRLLDQRELAAGDIVLLASGDRVPADGRLLETTGVSVDESMLTGESEPVPKDALLELADENTPLAERYNMLYTGTFLTGGNAKMVVTAVGDGTEYGKIAAELTKTGRDTTPLQEKLVRLGKIITVLGVAAAAVVFVCEMVSFALAGTLGFEKALEAFITSIVLIVAAVPEGLPTIMAVSLSLNIIKLSRQNALVRKMIASETVGCINVICSDKTGTLTENKMTVAGFYDGEWSDKPAGFTSDWMLHNICLNTTADIGENGVFIGNPSECAMLAFYERSAVRAQSGKSYRAERAEHELLQTFPFSSELKHMTTIGRVDGKIISYVKGSPESVLAMCRMEPKAREKTEAQMERAEKRAMRVIAFAHKELDAVRDYADERRHAEMERDMTFDGFVAISDPLRADVAEAVRGCRSAGIDVKMLTGDNIVTASAIAGELGLLDDGHVAMQAKEVETLDDSALAKLLPRIRVIARSTPGVKMRVVRLLKAGGNVVAVTGDGINDAPALKNADVGIAMGISGAEVSKQASDIVLLDDSFATIVKAVAWGRGIYENFRRFIQFQLTVNVSSVIVVLVSILLGLQAPFTALQLLWINIIMDGPPALTLGLEPIYGDLMKRAPTRRSENIVSRPMFARIGLTGGYMSAVFLLQYTTNFMGAAPGEMLSVLFTLFMLFQLFNAFNCRELGGVSIFRHLMQNRLMLGVVGVTFALQIVIIQFGGAMFGTVPLGIGMWGKIFALSFSVVLLSELVKLLRGAFRRRAA